MSENRLNRREMLILVSAAAASTARADTPLLRAKRIDHVSIAVADIDQAMAFYRRLFGNEVLKNNRSSGRYLRLGPCYAAIAPVAAGEAKRIDHFCAGIEGFQAAGLKASLANAGIPARESEIGLTVTDPDGNNFELAAEDSWTQLRNTGEEASPRREALFHARGMHHVAINVSDMEKATEFYRKLFGMEFALQGNPPGPRFRAGETIVGLYRPTGKPGLDHYSVLVDAFDPVAVVKELQALGAKAALTTTGLLPEFYDPEGIRMQVSMVTAPRATNK